MIYYQIQANTTVPSDFTILSINAPNLSKDSIFKKKVKYKISSVSKLEHLTAELVYKFNLISHILPRDYLQLCLKC